MSTTTTSRGVSRVDQSALLAPDNLASIAGAATLRCAAHEQLRALVPAPGHGHDWAGWIDAIEDLARLSRTPQDLRWHAEGDVWTHTKMVCDELVQGEHWLQCDADQRFVLYMAALLHDIAKPSTTRLDEDPAGEGGIAIRQPGHSPRGSIDARIMLWRAGVPFDLREQICRLIRAHQVPFHLFSASDPTRALRRLSLELRVCDLAALAEADMRGRRLLDGGPPGTDEVELMRELAREDGCYDRPRSFADMHTMRRYFEGDDVDVDSNYFIQPGRSRVVLLSGLPASGKDTWCMKHADGRPVVSFDDSREELGLRYVPNDGRVAHHTLDKVRELLRRGEPFIWNATHLGRQAREKSIGLLRRYDATVEIFYLERPSEVIMSRNRDRDTSLSNKAIEKMLFHWEVPCAWEGHTMTCDVASEAGRPPAARPRGG